MYSSNLASLTQACSSGNVEAVRVLLKQGDLREGADDGDSLLSLAASAGYYELCQVCDSQACSFYMLWFSFFSLLPGGLKSKQPDFIT